jgi:pantoate--beta-alanine ligase
MGALHEGHLSLLRRARELSDFVVMSLFVNPLQFGPDEDLSSYPRDEARDHLLAEEEKVDVMFLPSVDEMYPPGDAIRVNVGELGSRLEGRSRPGHFDGVATVVAKLFNLVRPDVAFFGQKDAQQVAVIKSLVRGLAFPTKIIVGPTVRDPSGLALSSRNQYLTSHERIKALVLWRSLQIAGRSLTNGDEIGRAVEAATAELRAEQAVRVDYFEAVDPATFGPPKPGGDVLFVVAATVGTTRLIDNLLVTTEHHSDLN